MALQVARSTTLTDRAGWSDSDTIRFVAREYLRDGRALLSIAALRSVAAQLAEDLRSAAASEAAEVLWVAVRTKSVPADEVLALREALVRTRRDWAAAGPSVQALAARALKQSKALAIDLWRARGTTARRQVGPFEAYGLRDGHCTPAAP